MNYLLMIYFTFLLLNLVFSLKAFSLTHLYELEYKGLKSTLFGTRHSIPFNALTQPVREIIENQEILITENTDILRPLTKSLVEQMGCLKAPGEANYIEALEEENRTELNKFVNPFLIYKNSEISIYELNLRGLYATYIAGHFVEGMDYHLAQYFKNKSVVGLENLQQVAAFFEEVTLDQLQDILRSKAGFDSSAALQAEVEYLEGVETETDEIDSLELKERNIKWLPKILEYHLTLSKKGIFCVGYHHLYGEQGLLNLLRKESFIVKRADSQGIFRDF